MLYRYGIVALVVLMPWHEIIVRLWPPLRIWDEVLLLLLAGALVRDSLRERTLPARRLLLPMAALLGVASVSGIANQLPPGHAAAGIRALFPYMVVGLAAAKLREEAAIWRILRLMVLMGTVAALYGIASYLMFRVYDGRRFMPLQPGNLAEAVLLYPYQCGGYPSGYRLVGTILNDNYMGDWLAMLVPVAFAMVKVETLPIRRGGYLLAVIVMTIALAWTFSRAAYAAFGVVLLLTAWRVDRRILLVLPLLGISAALLAFPADVYRFSNIRATEGGRVAAVRKAAAVQTRSPLYGRGPGTSGVMDLHYARIAAQMGLLGLATFAWLLLASLGLTRRDTRRSPNCATLSSVLPISMGAIMVAAFGGDVWEIPQLAYTFWTVAGLLQAMPASAGFRSPANDPESGDQTIRVVAASVPVGSRG